MRRDAPPSQPAMQAALPLIAMRLANTLPISHSAVVTVDGGAPPAICALWSCRRSVARPAARLPAGGAASATEAMPAATIIVCPRVIPARR